MSSHHPTCVIPSAPPFGFKGVLGKKVRDVFGGRISTISTGHCVRERLKSDEIFRQRHEETVARGGLVPFDEILPEVIDQFEQAKRMGVRAVWLDGVCRTREHAEKLHANGITIPKHTLFLAIATDLETCRSRMTHSLTVALDRTDRNDNGELEPRYTLHYKNEPEIIGFYSSIGIIPCKINGNVEKKVLATRVVLKVRDVMPFEHSKVFA